MKKILLVAAMFAVASLNSFGLTACANATLSSLAAGCTITNGAASWDLTLFGFGGTGPSQLGYAADPATSDIFVSFATVTNPSGGGLGFSVTFSDAAGGLNFFNASFGSPNQSLTGRPSSSRPPTTLNPPSLRSTCSLPVPTCPPATVRSPFRRFCVTPPFRAIPPLLTVTF